MSSADPSTPLDPVEALERLGRLPVRENGMRSLLQAVADLAREVVPGHPETSVSLLINDRPSTAVFTGELARAARHAETKVRAVAADLVRTGEFPRRLGPSLEPTGDDAR